MSFADALRADLAAAPIPVAAYMARCNAHYYATRDPLGPDGDFVTAPEISQMFGELVGAWLVDRWVAAGSPAARLVELGPGRGTLMADIRRVAAAAGWDPPVDLVETSPVLRVVQARKLAGAVHHDAFATIDGDAALFVVANEFFDALPVEQFERTASGWRERVVEATATGLAPALAADDAAECVPPRLRAAPLGSVVEVSPAAGDVAAAIGARLARDGGAALIVDYGHVGPATGDTLQAVRGHARADPFAAPGEHDLTCHVDFTALAVAAGVRAWGPVGQGDFLRALGIGARAATLRAQASGPQAAAIDAAVARLTGDAAMGRLFKVMALTPGGDCPPGFA